MIHGWLFAEIQKDNLIISIVMSLSSSCVQGVCITSTTSQKGKSFVILEIIARYLYIYFVNKIVIIALAWVHAIYIKFDRLISE